jgi:hypothetical protein
MTFAPLHQRGGWFSRGPDDDHVIGGPGGVTFISVLPLRLRRTRRIRTARAVRAHT